MFADKIFNLNCGLSTNGSKVSQMAEASEAEQPLQHDELHGEEFTDITSSDEDGETESDLG